MKKLVFSGMMALGMVIGLEAAPTDTVTQKDLQTLLQRLNQLEAENKAQAEKIKKLESVQNDAMSRINNIGMQATKTDEKLQLQTDKLSKMSVGSFATDGETTTNETGRIYTTPNGKKYYLADATARIFEPLSESGLQITPYGYLVLEGVYADRPLDCDWSTDFVKPGSRGNHTTLSVQDSILGIQFMTPEATEGWRFSGKAEFDLAGGTQNDYKFHWRHLYVNAEHETGWSILFGQTWHLWKMVSPSEIDGAWMENAGHPYRRSPQIRVTKKWDWENSSLEARVGIVKGGPGMGGDRDANGIQDNSASPWVLFEGALLYDRDAPWQNTQDSLQEGRWLLGIGGMYGRDRSQRCYLSGFDADGNPQYDFNGTDDDYDSMMGMVAFSVPIWRFTLKGQIYAGENLGGVQAGCGQTVLYHNMSQDYDVSGNGVRTVGGFIDLGYKLTDKWSFAIGWGCDNPFDSDVEGGVSGDPDAYYGILYNDRAYVDVFYSITANFRLGLEYARLLTSYDKSNVYGGMEGDYDSNRVQFSAFYDF